MLNPTDRALKDHLEVLSGREFDRAYMNAMIKEHRDDINEYRAEAQHGRNDDVKRFAAKALPTLEAHLRLARDTDKSLIGPGKKAGKVSAS